MKHSDEDIKKVARAIAQYCDEDWDEFIPEAIAALEAMFKPREPREFWIGHSLHCGHADVRDTPKDGYIHVREVTE